MKLIVAVDKKWGIGKANGLLFRLPADMKFFREMTDGKTVVMGLNTLRSFPNGAPLKNRLNIVLSDEELESAEGLVVCRSFAELGEELKRHASEDIFVIGGGTVYRQLCDICSEAYITKVDADGEATVFFPCLDEKSNWQCESISEPVETNGYTIRFCTYKNREVKAIESLY